jgi:hydrogenase nickel incorporation protein HypB
MAETIDIFQSVYDKNERLALAFNARLTQKNVFAVNVLGAPGAGKTSSLIRLIERLSKPSFVVEGDVASDIDAQKLTLLGVRAAQINTGGACHLDVPFVARVFEANAFEDGFLFVENIGNLICPAEFLLGEHVRLLVASTAEGSDKPYKYPRAFEKSDAVLLNKWDLTPYVDFDFPYFLEGVQKCNPSARVFKASAKTGGGFDEAAQWLTEKAEFVFKK